VYTSILDLTNRDPNEVAFVIGHEIGHTIDAQSCSGSGSPFNASFGISFIQDQFQKFCENHADNVGLQLAAGAGFDLTGAIKLLQDLQWYQEKSGISNASAFLANHPLNSSRIKNVEELEPIIESQIEKLGNCICKPRRPHGFEPSCLNPIPARNITSPLCYRRKGRLSLARFRLQQRTEVDDSFSR
jgi:hypothetical protein